MVDPYVYASTGVLINKLGIRDADTLRRFEIEATAQRMAEGFPDVDLDVRGYHRLHHHLFQDVYNWAGQVRTVDLSKGGDVFCRADFIERQLSARFSIIGSMVTEARVSAHTFAAGLAEHISELNAIHPFREGNGRTTRAFVRVAGLKCGHAVDLTRIDPAAWIDASKESFRTGSTEKFCKIICDCLR